MVRATVLALLAAWTGATAQAPDPVSRATGKGSWLVGGTGGFTRHSEDGGRESSIELNVSPSVLYFIRSGVAVGGTLGVSRVDSQTSDARSVLIGPALRGYFHTPSARLLGHAGASAQLAKSRLVDSRTTTVLTSSARSVAYEVLGGATWLASTHVGVYAELYYWTSDGKLERTAVAPLAFTQSRTGVRLGIAAFMN